MRSRGAPRQGLLAGPLDRSPRSAERRVIVVHPGALPVAHYEPLASALEPDVALHVADLEREASYFQAAFHGGRATVTIPELTERVVAELRAAELFDRPWTLLGWSFGGVVGHAMTALLTEAELPERALLLDSVAPVPAYTPRDEEIAPRLVLPWFCMYLGTKRGGDVPVPTAALERGADLDELLTEVLDAALARNVLKPGTELPGLRKVYVTYLDGLRRNNRLVATFAPHRSRTPVTLMRPDRGLLETPEPLGWEQLSEDLTLEYTPGDHYSMLRDPVAVKLVADAARTSASVG